MTIEIHQQSDKSFLFCVSNVNGLKDTQRAKVQFRISDKITIEKFDYAPYLHDE